MLLSTADVAWLNWEPEIQAAPEPKKLSAGAHDFGNFTNLTCCHVQQHLV